MFVLNKLSESDVQFPISWIRAANVGRLTWSKHVRASYSGFFYEPDCLSLYCLIPLTVKLKQLGWGPYSASGAVFQGLSC